MKESHEIVVPIRKFCFRLKIYLIYKLDAKLGLVENIMDKLIEKLLNTKDVS